MINLVTLIIIVLSFLSAVTGFFGIYLLTSIGWSLVFISSFLFIIMCILGFLLTRNQRG
jgi:hypothetical protein